ncbi:hypothetical protein D9757_004159 [Collybiopsis confluens]|uniref:Uncharacterized protein n=1 Tax=Collybiopsis confluens TaxID=2823264 RepID=A0A8H5HU52_9AGAR|nr:hypothetical protein D9757_004159 [Collybiopsis confluens]
MAAMVDRASSALHDLAPTPIVPQRRRREPSVEIIDVDQLDESQSTPRAGPSGAHSVNHTSPRQRRRFNPPSSDIVIIDSDDDDLDSLDLGPSSTSSQTQSRAQSLRPNTSETPVFPPMRRYPPPFPSDSGPVTANPMASDYERYLSANPRPPPTRHASGSRAPFASTSSATSTSRRAAALGIRAGGGIMTSAQVNAVQRRVERERLAQLRASGVLGPRFRARRLPPADDMHYIGVLRAFDPLDYLDFDLNVNGLVRYGPNFIHAAEKKPDEPDYLPEYTHAQAVPPGFLFDVDPSASEPSETPAVQLRIVSSKENPIVLDDEGEVIESFGASTSKAGNSVDVSPSSTSFICSNCLDPLLLGEGTSAHVMKLAASGLSVEKADTERRARRLWALRCGHLIDGKCLDILAYPPGALEESNNSDSKGKGKTKAVEPDDSDSDSDTENPPETYSNPIRSRLRSATATATADDPTSTQSIARRYLPAPIMHLFGGGSSPKVKPKPKRRRRGARKVQGTYTWSCPVAKCGKVHRSVKIDGVWGSEKENGEGAVALFI